MTKKITIDGFEYLVKNNEKVVALLTDKLTIIMHPDILKLKEEIFK